MSEQEKTDFSTAYEAGQQSVQHANGMPFIVVPHGSKVTTFPDRIDAPYFVKQVINLGTVTDFVTYVNRFADTHSIIFVNIPDGVIKAVLDYHKAEKFMPGDTGATPRHGAHVAVLQCRFTTEFEKIRANSGKQFKQEDFALFLEDILPHISVPDAATLLEIVGTLQANSKVEFKSGIRTDNGQVTLTYNETIEAKAGQSGSFAIPQQIIFGVQVHRGGAAYALTARFRYRISGANLLLWYDLDQIDKAIETSMNDTVEHIKNGKIVTNPNSGNSINYPPANALVLEGTV